MLSIKQVQYISNNILCALIFPITVVLHTVKCDFTINKKLFQCFRRSFILIFGNKFDLNKKIDIIANENKENLEILILTSDFHHLLNKPHYYIFEVDLFSV